LSWTFKDNFQYTCSVGNKITVEGSYQLTGNDDKILVLTSHSGNSINRYTITTLTESELTLNGNAENTNLVLHFKPNL
ncbi:MAG TPA: hypothetical protein PK987_09980, partial [Ferruginibacter sp.]|nr:hypothetical protein [Ferruginibacter sp.]